MTRAELANYRMAVKIAKVLSLDEIERMANKFVKGQGFSQNCILCKKFNPTYHEWCVGCPYGGSQAWGNFNERYFGIFHLGFYSDRQRTAALERYCMAYLIKG